MIKFTCIALFLFIASILEAKVNVDIESTLNAYKKSPDVAMVYKVFKKDPKTLWANMKGEVEVFGIKNDRKRQYILNKKYITKVTLEYLYEGKPFDVIELKKILAQQGLHDSFKTAINFLLYCESKEYKYIDKALNNYPWGIALFQTVKVDDFESLLMSSFYQYKKNLLVDNKDSIKVERMLWNALFSKLAKTISYQGVKKSNGKSDIETKIALFEKVFQHYKDFEIYYTYHIGDTPHNIFENNFEYYKSALRVFVKEGDFEKAKDLMDCDVRGSAIVASLLNDKINKYKIFKRTNDLDNVINKNKISK